MLMMVVANLKCSSYFLIVLAAFGRLWQVLYRSAWFFTVLDGSGHFQMEVDFCGPTSELFSRVLAARFGYFLMIWPVLDVSDQFRYAVASFRWL